MIIISDEIVSCEVVTSKQSKKKNREDVLIGKTYKIKHPHSEHAFYVTINDLNGKPFEIFINSKDMGEYQWISALTRITSALFREVDDIRFLIDEMKQVFDPKGGYWEKGTYINSLVSAIGNVIEKHCSMNKCNDAGLQTVKERCKKCNADSVISSGGCKTCTNCGDSKCE